VGASTARTFLRANRPVAAAHQLLPPLPNRSAFHRLGSPSRSSWPGLTRPSEIRGSSPRMTVEVRPRPGEFALRQKYSSPCNRAAPCRSEPRARARAAKRDQDQPIDITRFLFRKTGHNRITQADRPGFGHRRVSQRQGWRCVLDWFPSRPWHPAPEWTCV